jgi:hypothetical protein
MRKRDLTTSPLTSLVALWGMHDMPALQHAAQQAGKLTSREEEQFEQKIYEGPRALQMRNPVIYFIRIIEVL